jgi:hypothetical protein
MTKMKLMEVSLKGALVSFLGGLTLTASASADSACYNKCFEQKVAEITQADPSLKRLAFDEYSQKVLRPAARACMRKCINDQE